MKTITVSIPQHSYPVTIGENLLSEKSLFEKHIHGKQVMVITNETVAPLYLQSLLDTLKNFHSDYVILPDGEKHKTLSTLTKIYDALLEKKHHRDTTLISLGGGVIGDMVGFAAATYQRGVKVIHVPTSLLAQVDASIGGKTAVNHPLGKNMIGAFHQPQAVIMDIALLKTLPKREFVSGLAEIIKHALIKDKTFYVYLEQNIDKILSFDPQVLEKTIVRSCEIKASFVAEDEREHHTRAFLNFGHTIAHGIEQCLNYEGWLHGEAVSVGMRVASKLSSVLGCLTEEEDNRIAALLSKAGLPLLPPEEMSAKDILSAIRLDKKILDNTLRFVLLKGIGNVFLKDLTSEDELKKVLVTCGFAPGER